VRIERIALKDHRDVPISRRAVVDDSVADRDRALGDRLQTGDHSKSRRLAASGWPDEDNELAVTYRERHVVHRARSIRIDLCDMLKDDSAIVQTDGASRLTPIRPPARNQRLSNCPTDATELAEPHPTRTAGTAAIPLHPADFRPTP
jgi:hypothetical protein